MRLWILLGILLAGLVTPHLPLEGQGQDLQPVAWTFGLSLSTGINNEVFTLFLVKTQGLNVLSTQPITREQFMLQSQGAIESRANPGRENLLRKYKVNACLHPDSNRYYMDCAVFDDLWRLRFMIYPYVLVDGHNPGTGWAGKRSSPTPSQMMRLADHGIERLSDLVYGEAAFRLLRNVGDSTWVRNYKSGSSP